MLPNESYQVQTSFFEGPLELLLHLIEQEELDVTRLALAQVTTQFLDYVEAQRNDPQIEIIAEFLVVAAKLLWLKSKTLLPQRSLVTAGSQQDDDEVDELVLQLRTYRRYKEAAQQLREREHAGVQAHVRVAPLPRPRVVTVDLAGLTVQRLQTLAQNLIYPSDRPHPEDAIQRPRISIEKQIKLIQQRLRHWKRLGFRTLLGQRPTRLEVVATLQAILELIKQQVVRASQSNRFGDILIEPVAVPVEQSAAAAAAPEA
ncbi:MAG: segregation/condensation protein A [Chloroflexota bacterium]|nr:segregation/condensation protein A [Chloroflexota bacterium]